MIILQVVKDRIDAIVPILERMGFGRKTEVDLPNEFVGTLPSREWKMRKYGKAWFQGETLIDLYRTGKFSSHAYAGG